MTITTTIITSAIVATMVKVGTTRESKSFDSSTQSSLDSICCGFKPNLVHDQMDDLSNVNIDVLESDIKHSCTTTT
jgi:hypothetical protein